MKGLKVKDEDNDNEFMFAVKTKKVEQKKDDAQTEKVVVTDLGFKVTPPERAREDRPPRRYVCMHVYVYVCVCVCVCLCLCLCLCLCI